MSYQNGNLKMMKSSSTTTTTTAATSPIRTSEDASSINDHHSNHNGTTPTMSMTSPTSTIPTQSFKNDPNLIMNLVIDFFNSQFELKNAQCPFPNNNNTTTLTKTTTTTMTNNTIVVDNSYENHLKKSLRALGKSFEQQFEKKLFDLLKELEQTGHLQSQTCRETYLSLSNEMFVRGIQWNHIVTYFVFSADFAYYISNILNLSTPTVFDVAKWLTLFTTKNLLPWIEKNGGWDGIINFAQETVAANGNGLMMDMVNNPNDSNLFNKVDVKNIICGAAWALGALSLGLFLSSK